MNKNNTTLDKLINNFKKLNSIDLKEYALSILENQYLENRRNEISDNAKKTFTQHKKGLIKKGNSEELFKDLESD